MSWPVTGWWLNDQITMKWRVSLKLLLHFYFIKSKLNYMELIPIFSDNKFVLIYNGTLNILVLQYQMCVPSNKPFIYSKTVCCVFTPSSWLVARPICCLDTCVLFLSSRGSPWRRFNTNLFLLQKKKRTLPLSLSLHSHIKTSVFLPECSFTPTGVLEACPKANGRAPQAAASVIMRCWGLQHGANIHVCACHSWHSTPAKSVILCVHQAGSGTLTTAQAAGMLSFIQ